MTSIPIADAKALDTYIDGWKQGDGLIIHSVQADDYRLTGVPGIPVVHRHEFVNFFSAFRAQIADAGGPQVQSEQFMQIHGQIRRIIGDVTVESALFIVPGFGSGTYMAAAKNGEVIWEEAVMLSIPLESTAG